MYDEVYFWFLAAAVFLIIEILSPHLVTLWFAIGAISAVISVSFGIGLESQMIVFFVVSILLLISLRPIYVKYVKVNKIRTNADSLIGETAVVTMNINNKEGAGLVKVKGQIWSAKSDDDEVILAGKDVKVLKIEGVKLVVKLEKIN